MTAAEGHLNLPGDPDPLHHPVPQFPMHVLISPSAAAGSWEMLPRHPVINGERAAQGRGGKGGRKAGKSTKYAIGKNWIQDPSWPFGAPPCHSHHSTEATPKSRPNAHCPLRQKTQLLCLFLSAQVCRYMRLPSPITRWGRSPLPLPLLQPPSPRAPAPTTPRGGNFP